MPATVRLALPLAGAAFALCALAAAAGEPSSPVRVEGFEDATLRDGLIAVLPARAPPQSLFEAERLAEEAADISAAFLRAEGFFQGEAAAIADDDPPRAVLKINPGPRFSFAEPTVTFAADRPPPAALAALLRAIARHVSDGAPARSDAVRAAELDALAALLRDRDDVLVLADEVYEHVVYDGAAHASVVAHPELRARSLATFSFGKTLHATGWRLGYCVAPPALSAEFRKVHQFNTFSLHSPSQHAVARYLDVRPEAWLALPAFFQAKRDRLCAGLAGSGIGTPRSAGTYFQLLDFAALSPLGDLDMAERLICDAGIALIPLSPFYQSRPKLTQLRICVAKRDETLDLAIARLRSFAASLA